MSPIEKLVFVRKQMGYSQKEFANRVGRSLNLIKNIENARTAPKTDFIKAVSDFTEIPMAAFKNGTITTRSIKFTKDSENEYKRNKALYSQKEILNTNVEVLLLPVSAQGGTLNDFMVSVKESECERIISPIKGADFAMTVAGDSMAPEYPSGCQILIKKINEKVFIEWGKVYVLDTCNGSVIKRVLPAGDKKTVKCESINSAYPPFEVPLAEVYGIYRILMMMSVK